MRKRTSKAEVDLLIYRQRNKTPPDKQHIIWRKIKAIRNIQDGLKSKFERIKATTGDMLEMSALNTKFVRLERRWTELFDEVTNNIFNRI
ncbi:MAG: hypothetical protein MJZ66_04090 [Bacteroidales bacterium]|nr:hypothetical protein [Bacteroidales bacterium]